MIKKRAIETIRGIFNIIGLEVTRKRELDPNQLDKYREIYGDEILAKKPFYNVGAGDFWHPYWTNIDFSSEWYSKVQKDFIHFDLMSLSPLPIADDSAEIVYTSHTIEHVKEPAVANLFKEAFRVLKPSGILRVTTGPDAETDFRALMHNDASWFYWDEMYQEPEQYSPGLHGPATSVPLEERWLHHVASALAPNDARPSKVKYSAPEIREIIEKMGFEGALDHFTSLCEFDPTRPGSHISWWTHDKVARFMKQAGFTKIYRSGHGQSVSPILRNTMLFDSTHPTMSIYVEAIK